MAHVKVLSPTELPLSDLLGPLPKGDELTPPEVKHAAAWAISQLRSRLEEGVRAAKGNLTLVLPPGLLETIADNIMQLAKDEPCGLRGSALKLILIEEWPSQETVLLEIKADANTPTTHKFDVVLRPDTLSWYTKMAYIFRSFTKRRVVISPKYELKKTSIYNFNA